jgi:rhamnosyl/mannosyltransferase
VGALKVLHVYRTYFPDTQGGLEEVIRQICRNTRAEGVESRVFTLSDNPDPAVIESGEARVVRVRKSLEIASNSFTFSGLGEFRRQAAWADIVHYHFPWPWADVMHTVAGRPRNSVVTYHSDIVRQKWLFLLYRPLKRHFLGSMQRIVATSPNYLATSETLARYRGKTDVIPIGIDRQTFPDVDENSESFRQLEAEYGRDFFFFVSVMRYYKGLHILLDAIRDAPFQVVIAGKGPAEQDLHRQAKALGLSNVRFCGFVSDAEKMSLFRLCRGLVFPSYLRSEAFGVTLLEAAMSGKPLISAEIGTGTTYINIDGETGLVVEPGCPDSLRQAMDRLHNNPGEAREMGERARQRYEQLFTGAQMGRQYAELYRDLLAERGPDLALDRSE